MPQTNSIPILLIDDDQDDYLIVRGLIAKISNPRFKLDWVSDSETAKIEIAKEAHAIYLVDYRLGADNCLEMLADFDLPNRRQPFIILTGAGDSRIEEAAMNIGVADYLVKGHFDVELLARVLRYSLQRKSMEMQRVEALRQINQSKDEFIGLASHQLRTPATAVKQYVGMLVHGYAGELTPAQLSFAESAYTSNERQLKIVDDILKIARLDMDKVTLRTERRNLAELISDVQAEIQPILNERHQLLNFRPPKTKCYSNIDTMYLGMALTNLLDNASKYSPEKSTVHISLDTKQDTVELAITDHGVGIAATDFDKLFVKFSCIPNPLSVEVGGSGLGLYWSNEIVRLHGGEIKVTSKPGQGTSFTVRLPAS